MGNCGVDLTPGYRAADIPLDMNRFVATVWGRLRAAVRPFLASFEPFYRLPRLLVLCLGLVSVLGLAVLDWAIGPEVGVGILYVMAIMAVTFHASWVDGAVVATIASAAGLLTRLIGPNDLGVATVVWSLFSELAVFLTLVVIVHQIRRLVHLFEHQSRVDLLTGALNSRGLFETLERERSRAERYGLPMTVVFVDLDGMKEINDRLGHSGGDQLLRSFAEKIGSSVRDEDLFARIGGDEFVVALPDTGHQQALAVVRRLRREVGREISASYGVVTFLRQPAAIEDLIEAADSMMYVAKRAGGNRVVGEVRSGSIETDRFDLTYDLAEAIEIG